jgi:hypothetical protein
MLLFPLTKFSISRTIAQYSRRTLAVCLEMIFPKDKDTVNISNTVGVWHSMTKCFLHKDSMNLIHKITQMLTF